ncbi:MAG TPA: hypothetical protein VFG86_08170, partial [Chloroflexota bacterium]|nr:hypothetical protein [Chloroflexota bacterium]
LSSDLHARAFADFAAFLKHLASAPHFTISNTAPLLQVAARSARFLEHEPNAPAYPRLLHTVEEGALTQLARIGAPLKPHTLTVVSPFHHHEGAPIKALAEALNVKRLNVAVPGQGTTCSFPFATAAAWPVPAQAVRLSGEGTQRRLHAKWYELACADKLITLTGSVNATATGLESTHNAEVGVLREALPSATLAVTLTAVPIYQADAYELPPTGRPVVVATLDKDGALIGQLLDCAKPAGTWQVSLHGPGQPDWNGPTVTVFTDASFQTRLYVPVNPDTGSLELRLTRGNEVARGWLNFPAYLALSYVERARRQALRRLANGAATADDLTAFLRFLQRETDLLFAPGGALPGSAGGTKPAAGELAIRPGALKPREFNPATQRVHTPSAATLEAASATEQARQLLALFMGQDPATGAPRPRPTPDDEPEEGEGYPNATKKKRLATPARSRQERSLEEFERHLAEQLTTQLTPKNRPRPPPIAFARALESWGSSVLGFRAVHLGQRAQALQAAQRWFKRATSIGPLVGLNETLDALVVGVGLVLAAEAPTVEAADPLLRYMELSASTVHARLEAYYGGSLDLANAQACLARFLALPVGEVLADVHINTLAAQLAWYGAAPTARSLLTQFMAQQLSYKDLLKAEDAEVRSGKRLFRPEDLAL